MILTDTHCHLFDERFGDVGAVIARARESGVKKIIVPGLDIETSRRAVELAEKYDELYAMVGVHPEIVSDKDKILALLRKEKVFFELEKLIKSSKKIVGVGEIGMDFYRDRERKTKEMQINLFRAQLELAAELDLPVMIHMREAEEEIRSQKGLTLLGLRGQFHCWGGSGKMLEWVLESGFYVSFCGNVTYKSAGELREMLKTVPPDRLLLETDGPYLVPEPLRGKEKVNEPKNVKIIAEFIAKTKDVDIDKLTDITTENARCLYCAI